MAQKFNFKVENTVYHWDTEFITGRQVRSLGSGIPDNMDLYLKVQGKPGRLVGNDESIDLKMPGVEKFYSQQSSSTAGKL